MSCIVPTCSTSGGVLRLFPEPTVLVHRWLEAISIGSGMEVTAEGIDLSTQQLCQRHFVATNDGAVQYQEPKIFFNCNENLDVELGSCRFCLRFYKSCDMLPMKNLLTGTEIEFVVSELLSIDLQSNDLLELICLECLARLDLLTSIRNDFMDAEMKFHNIINCSKEVVVDFRKPIETSLSVEMIEGDDLETSDDICNEYSGDEWTLINEADDKVESTSSDESEQNENATTENVSGKCYICHSVLQDANKLPSHLKEYHSNLKTYHCEDCSLDFLNLLSYNKHLSRHDQTDRPFKCHFCSMCFKMSRSKMLHENARHGTKHVVKSIEEKRKPSICETCGESFMYLSKLRSHVRRKHGSRDKPTCKLCGKSFTTKSSLQRHMLLHTNEKPYVCSNCDASYRRLLDLKHHVQQVHEGKNPHVCGECSQDFKTYISLYYHKQVVHLNKPKPHLKYSYNRKQPKPSNRKRSNTRPSQYKCKLCYELFSKSSILRKHIANTHANESYPVLECPECPRTFVTIHSLCMHKATHTDKCFCKECDKRFASFQALKNHIASIHEQKQFTCPVCLLKTYKSQSALQQHMTLHTKGKPFQCEFCDKCFNRKTQLAIHRRLHTGEKPFECPKCSKRFSDDGTFCKHKKRCLLEPVPASN